MKKFKSILYLLIIVLFSCKNGNKDQNAKKVTPPVSVDITIAEKQEFPSIIEVNGTFLAEEMIELHPESSGKLTYLNIPDGAIVKAGTILAKVNDADLQAQLQQQTVQLELAKKTEIRLKKLLSVNGVDQASYDAALSQVNLYEANSNVIKAQIEKTVIKAPFSGRLGLRLISQGAYVSPSTLVGTLQQTDKIKIDFTVPETYQNLIFIGKTINIQSSEKKLLATISAIEPQINASSRNIKVRARLESNNLTPGSFVKVLIEDREKRILVPTNSIIPDAISNQIILIKNGKAVFKNIETGIRTANLVEVSKGIEVNDSIVITGLLFVRPNTQIKVKSVVNLNKLIKSDGN